VKFILSPVCTYIDIISFCRYGDPGDIVAPVVAWIVVYDGNYGRMGFHVEEFEESPGLIYVDRGALNVYNSTWKTIIYVDLEKENIERFIVSLYRSY